MAKYSVVNGVYRKVSKKYAPVDGVYRNVTKAFEPVDGVYRQYFSSDIPASKLVVGDSVWMEVDGTLTEFLVVHQGNPNTATYDSSCKGTWLMAVNIASTTRYSSSTTGILGNEIAGTAFYDGSIAKSVADAFYNKLARKDVVKTVKIPYVKKSGTYSTALKTLGDGLSVNCFIPTCREVNLTTYTSNSGSSGQSVNSDYDGGTCLAYFKSKGNSYRVAYNASGAKATWWTRTMAGTDYPLCIQTTGAAKALHYYNAGAQGIRPMFVIYSDTLITKSDGINIIA